MHMILCCLGLILQYSSIRVFHVLYMENIHKLPCYLRLILPEISIKINHYASVEIFGNLLTQPQSPY